PSIYNNCPNNFTLDAGELISSNNTNIEYKWFLNDTEIGNTPEMSFVATASDSEECLFSEDILNMNFVSYTIVVKDNNTDCVQNQTFYTASKIFLCPDTNQSQSTQEEDNITLSTKIYPNPGQQEETFYYEI